MSRRARAAERKRAYLKQNADRVLSDTTFDRFRTERALRWLVLIYIGITVAMALLWVLHGNFAGIAGMLAWIPAYLLLRVAVRAQADLPDHVLDERMRAERDRVYVNAFRITASLVFAAVCVMVMAVEFRPEPASLTLQSHEVNAIFWSVFSVIMGAPSLVMAWNRSRE